MKKYELVKDQSIHVNEVTLYRIRALAAFADVAVGEIGGYIEGERNLSQDGDAWVYDNAKVYGNAQVIENAHVSGYACIGGDAKLSGDAWVGDEAAVNWHAQVSGSAQVSGNARVGGRAQVSGRAWVYDGARVCGYAKVDGEAKVSGNADVYGSARVGGSVWVTGNAHVCGDAEIDEDARVNGNIWLCGNAWVSEPSHIFSAGPIGSRKDVITFFRTRQHQIEVKTGCFWGTIAEFRAEVTKTHGDSMYGKTYQLLADVAEQWINLAGDETSASDHVGR